MKGAQRLDQLLVARGVGGRRAVTALVRGGRVTVDGELVRAPASKVAPGSTVALDDEPVLPIPTLVAWHKPVGVVTTLRDPWGREGVDAVLPARWREALHPVGRLDKDTSGLLLFSSDGQLTQRMLHPKHAAPRRYKAGVEAVPDDLGERLAAGVSTADGVARATLEAVDGQTVTVVIREGRHRIVRRMLHNAGASVVTLHRLSHGEVTLGDLAPRAWRVVTP